MMTKRDFPKMLASLWLNKKSQSENFAKGWLSTLLLRSNHPLIIILEENGLKKNMLESDQIESNKHTQ